MRVSLELRTLVASDVRLRVRIFITVRSVRPSGVEKTHGAGIKLILRKADWRGIQYTFMNLERGIIVFALAVAGEFCDRHAHT